jgi:hypothetical protein
MAAGGRPSRMARLSAPSSAARCRGGALGLAAHAASRNLRAGRAALVPLPQFQHPSYQGEVAVVPSSLCIICERQANKRRCASSPHAGLQHIMNAATGRSTLMPSHSTRCRLSVHHM